MRALRKLQAGPGLELVDIPEPQVGPGEVKVRVMRAGLCGTDLHLEEWDDWAAMMVHPPMTIGHEFYGEIVDVADDVTPMRGSGDLQVGMRCSVEGHIVCGFCRNCRAGRKQMCVNTNSIGVNRDGGFADYVVVPAANVWVQPAEIDPELGALFDPFGNATHTALQWPLVGEDVLITGAGPIGVMAAGIARHAGARHVVVTDLSDFRLGLASGAGANRVVNVGREQLADVQRELGMTEGFDIAFEMSGAPAAMETIIENCNYGAKVSLLGLPKGPFPINWGKAITHMLTFKGIYGREMFETWYQMTAMLQTSPEMRETVRSVITHRVRLEDWQDAWAAARSGEVGKVVLEIAD